MSDPMVIMSVAGARPNFIKIAPIKKRTARRAEEFHPRLLHTGKHCDGEMLPAFMMY